MSSNDSNTSSPAVEIPEGNMRMDQAYGAARGLWPLARTACLSPTHGLSMAFMMLVDQEESPGADAVCTSSGGTATQTPRQ